jgi:hypothetical protein
MKNRLYSHQFRYTIQHNSSSDTATLCGLKGEIPAAMLSAFTNFLQSNISRNTGFDINLAQLKNRMRL